MMLEGVPQRKPFSWENREPPLLLMTLPSVFPPLCFTSLSIVNLLLSLCQPQHKDIGLKASVGTRAFHPMEKSEPRSQKDEERPSLWKSCQTWWLWQGQLLEVTS